jgi:uncharacterized membrane-anchored protein YhcB (DUF1043 family)
LTKEQKDYLFHGVAKKTNNNKKKTELIEENDKLEDQVKNLTEKVKEKEELLTKSATDYEAVLEHIIKSHGEETRKIHNQIIDTTQTNNLI